MTKSKKSIMKRTKLQASRKPANAGKRNVSKIVASKGYAPGLLGNIGKAIGGWVGGIPGSRLGSSAGNWLGSITGMGTYSVNKNVLMTNNSVPSFRAETNGTAIITHREFIRDISGSTGFQNSVFPINPGLASTFPWLSSIAQNYEQYEFLGLIFEFKSTSANALNSTNTALGVVVSSTQYDSLDAPFTNKQAMEAYQFTTSTAPCSSMIHPVECDPRQNALCNMYVRNNVPPVGSDKRFYDLGNYEIATVGMQAPANIGELWVSYSVKLLKPRLPTDLQVTTVAHYQAQVANDDLFDKHALATGYEDLLDLSTPNQIRFKSLGDYVIHLSVFGYSPNQMTWNPYTFTHAGGVVLKNAMAGLSLPSNGIVSYPSDSATRAMKTICLRITSLPANIQFFDPVLLFGPVFTDLYAFRTPSFNVALSPIEELTQRLKALEGSLKPLNKDVDSDFHHVPSPTPGAPPGTPVPHLRPLGTLPRF